MTEEQREQRERELKYIHDNPEIYLQKAKKKGYICPLCGNGTGNDGTGITTKDNIHYSCFKCGEIKNSDIIEIIAKVNGISDGGGPEAFDAAYKIYNIKPGTDPAPAQPAPKKTAKPQPEQPPTDYTNYFLQVRAKITETDYPQRRGLSQATINRFGLGYDPKWISPKAAAEAAEKGYNIPPSPRLIVPSNRYDYFARDTRETIPAAAQGYKKMFEGKISTFNAAALKTAKQPIFITEGAISALSIIEVGGEAVATGTTSRAAAFIKEVEQDRPQQPLIIAMDNDDAGRTATEKIKTGLEKARIPFIVSYITGGHKDANDALTADRAAFTEAVQAAIRQAEALAGGNTIDILFKGENIAEEQPTQEPAEHEREYPTSQKPQPDNIAEYLERTFTDDIKRFESFKNRKTGFANLDKHTGGLYPGLYVIGSISSAGKTTFIHQMADQLAEAGDHILFFSLEQSRLEMVTKSLSRITARHDTSTATSAIRIRGGGISNPAVIAAAEEYSAIAKRVSVIECNFNEHIESILDYVKKYMGSNPGIKPVVIVDYLQIIPPSDPRQDIRTKVDNIVRGLKKIQSENDLVIIVVSSINRSNYLYPIDFESFKESGGIEYTADVIWGLQLQILNDEIFESDKKIKEKREMVRIAKKATPRKMELICLKNRYGISSYKCGFNYYPQFDLFIEDNTYAENNTEESQPSSQSTGSRTGAKGKTKGSARNPEVIEDVELIRIK